MQIIVKATHVKNTQPKSLPKLQDVPVSFSIKNRKLSNYSNFKNETQRSGTLKTQIKINRNKSADQLVLKNSFQILNEEKRNDKNTLNALPENTVTKHSQSKNQQKSTAPKPMKMLSIFIHGVNNFQKMLKKISSVVPIDSFNPKFLINGNFRIHTSTTDNYKLT